jgi:hypothetical protein
MTFAKLCEHGGFDPHAILRGDCPGGSVLPPDTELLAMFKTVIGETFIDAMGWGESKPMAALEVYAVAELQAQAVLDALAAAQEGKET